MLSLGLAMLLGGGCASGGGAAAGRSAVEDGARADAETLASWPCTIRLPMHPESSSVEELHPALRRVFLALAAERHGEALREAHTMMEVLAAEVARGFHAASSTPEEASTRMAERREVLETWVYGPLPALRVGVERFWLAPWLSAALATSAVRVGRFEEARAWLIEGGAPTPLEGDLLRCLLWVDLHGSPERIRDYVEWVDWNAPEWAEWRALVEPYL